MLDSRLKYNREIKKYQDKIRDLKQQYPTTYLTLPVYIDYLKQIQFNEERISNYERMTKLGAKF